MSTDPSFEPDPSRPPAAPTPQRTPAVVLTDPVRVAAALPYLLGFTPERSLVLLGLRETAQGSALVVAARYDLPRDLGAATFEIEELVEHAVGAFVTARTINAAVITVVGDAAGSVDGPLPQLALVDHLITALDDADIAVKDAAYTDGSRVSIYGCTDPTWPTHDAAITQAIRDEVAAGFVYAGLAPSASRDDLQAEVAYRDDELSDDVGFVLQGWDPSQREDLEPQQVADQATELTGLLTSPEPVDASQIAALGTGLTHVKVRDAVIWDLAHASNQQRTHAVANLLRATQHLPERVVAPTATVLAIESWMRGDGARANIGIDRALTADPKASLAQLVKSALGAGLAPQVFAEMFTTTLTRQMCTGQEELPPPAERDQPEPPAAGRPLAI